MEYKERLLIVYLPNKLQLKNMAAAESIIGKAALRSTPDTFGDFGSIGEVLGSFRNLIDESYQEAVNSWEQEMRGLTGDTLVDHVRTYTQGQLTSWRRIPGLALEATDRIGVYDDRLEIIYRDGVLPVSRIPNSVRYNTFVDLETGDLMGFNTEERAVPEYIPGTNMKDLLVPLDSTGVLEIARSIRSVRASDIIEQLLELVRMPYPKAADIEWKNDIRRDFNRFGFSA